MANGTDAEEFVLLSKVRTGLKREFEFALKAQAEICGSLGRTRARKAQNGVVNNGVQENLKNNNKRLKKEKKNSDSIDVMSEEEAKSDVVDVEEAELVEEGPTEPGNEGKMVGVEEDKDEVEKNEKKVEKNEEKGEESLLNESPSYRRFTRSALKPKVETKKISSVKRVIVANGDDVVTTTPVKGNAAAAARKFPAKLKELLELGILEGLQVKYMRGSRGARVRGQGETGLQGVIQGSGILCFCRACKGDKVVTPTVYELHAGSSNKRPPEYIYLENGNTLRDVMNACIATTLATVEETVRLAIGGSYMKKSAVCLNCKGSMPDAGTGKSMLLCNSCVELKESKASLAQPADMSDGSPNPFMVTKSSDSALNYSSSRCKSQGRVTTKDLRLHKLVFEEDVLPDGTEVAYFVRGQKLLVGYKKGFGILCSCCDTEVSPSQFEAHAGWATRRKPFQHIYTSNGVSLHELSVSLSKDEKFCVKVNDDLCSICLDGGDLLCCDSCPRVFHLECASLPGIPTGKWYCKRCQNTYEKEKFVAHNANALAAGRVAGVDPIEQITKRCIRIVKTLEVEVGGCALCRGHDFSRIGFDASTVMICDQCEKEFHVGCLKDHKMDDLKEVPKGKWFCCTGCNRIHAALQKLIVRGEEKLPDSHLNAIMKKHKEKGSESGANLDIRWRVLSGKSVFCDETGELQKFVSCDETRELLSKAVDIFHDRFAPIIDSAKVRDLIPSMVYGKSLQDQEFGGMCCALLTVNQVVVSAGIFRIFGQDLAELPLVATLTECQGQGYFQCLFNCIEKFLGFLNVSNLVLPAADEAESIWTNKFGFNKMTQDEVNKFRRDHPIMIFQGTSMLQKSVPKCLVGGKPIDG